MSHVTGGGLASNLERVLPAHLTATVDRSTWALPPVFGLVRDVGSVPAADLERTLNCGVGMVALVDPADAPAALALLERHAIAAWVAGEVRDAGDDEGGRVHLVGEHA
jgi:phosphoribosylformylglycinamidine cyclo-ligase